MPSLSELQRRFVDAVLAPAGDLPDLIRPAGIDSAARLDVYRNNTFSSLGKLLAALYPVVERLVGAEFFRHSARCYIDRYPSRSGDLGDYGSEFPEFLATFEPASQLVYLADVARLERARHQAARAAARAPLDIAALARLTADDYENLRLIVHPSVRLLNSPYPVLQIWQFNQLADPGAAQIDLASGGCQLLVWRHDLDVVQETLTSGSLALLQNLTHGRDFASACEQALAAEPDFDLGTTLQQWVARQVVVDFVL